MRRADSDQAPDKLLAETRDASGKVIRTRPLFPYPQVANRAAKGRRPRLREQYGPFVERARRFTARIESDTHFP